LLTLRHAFVENYKQHPMFAEDLGEFEDAKEVVTNLFDE
jgi:hypothetical protein